MADGDDLAGALAGVLGVDQVVGLQRLSGGASRETWAFEAVADGAARPLILQRERPGGVRTAEMETEVRLLRAAAGAGVPVAAVVCGGDEVAPGDPIGGAFVITERIDGETIPRRILRDDGLARARSLLAGQCGAALAAIHRIPPDAVDGLEATDQLDLYAEVLHDLGHPHPALELGIRWLRANRPPAGRKVVVHGDFRNGNLVVGPDGLRAVLDWELAHLGDPLEDLGWLCVRSWRFGAAPRVGGFGPVEELIAAYEEAGGARVDRSALHWWEALGTLKWGIMCIVQAETHRSGVVRSVELAAIGRRVCEVEHDLLLLLPEEAW